MRYDQVIIGAGVIGAASAYHLKRDNPEMELILIDKGDRAGAGNTSRSAALYRNIFSSNASKTLSTSSISYYEELGYEIQLDPIGYLWMFSKDQWRMSKPAIDTLDPQRDELEFPGSHEISEILNINVEEENGFPGIHRGILGHRCGSLSGMGLAQHYADLFQDLGGDIQYGSEVIGLDLAGIDPENRPWAEPVAKAVNLADGDPIGGKGFLFATGAWTHELLSRIGIFAGVLPKKRQLFGIKIKDPADMTSIDAGGNIPAMILPAGGVYIKPLLKGKMIFVGLADDLGRPYSLEDSDSEEDFFHGSIEPVLNHYFPNLRDYQLRSSWAGHYSYHWPDKNPVIESVSNIHWSSGTSGSGIMKADAIGRITADEILGNRYSTLHDGNRFRVSDLSLRKRRVQLESFVI